MTRLTGFLCPPWTSGCTDCCHWVTRTPWSCVCCWRRQMQSQFQSQMQSQGLALPPEPEVGPSAARESCVDPSRNDQDTGDSEKRWLCVEENPPCLVVLGRLYEGSITVHNIHLCHDQVKVGVEEVRDADASIPVLTQQVQLVGQTLNTFVTWPTHLVKRLSEQGAMGPDKPTDRSDHDVNDPLYLMTLTIPQLFQNPLQVMWNATVFGLFNDDFPLYIKHGDLSKITHNSQCLNISIIQLWILHMTKTSMRAGNSDNSKRDVYLGAYLNGLDNYLKGIINMLVLFFNTFGLALVGNINILIVQYAFMFVLNALKGLDDTPQSKSKVVARWIVVKCNRQKGSTECGYYVMHWMSTIILGSFKNNWETIIYFNDARPLELERLKVLHI
ncbi:hypothetical protein HKD37_04G010187 [Glycine soja]